MLGKLAEGPMRSERLKKETMMSSPTMWEVQSTFDWLREKGYIEKMGPARSTAPYRITESGLRFLRGIKKTAHGPERCAAGENIA